MTLNQYGGGSQGALTYAFRRMDEDKSGTVGAAEITRFLKTMTRGMDELNTRSSTRSSTWRRRATGGSTTTR